MALPRRSSPRSLRPISHRRSELAVEAKGRVVSKKSSGGSLINKMSSFKKGDEVRVRTPVGRLGTTALRLVMWLGAVVVSDVDADDGHLEVIYNGNFPRDDPFRTVPVAVKDVKLQAPRPAPTPANMAAPRPTTAGKSLPRLKIARHSSSMALPRRSSPRSSRPIIHRRSELAVEPKGRVVSKKPSGSGSPINKMSPFKKGDEVRVRTPLGRLGTTTLRLVMCLGAVVVSNDDDGHLHVIYNGNFPRDDPFRTVRVAVKDVKLPAPRPVPTPSLANMAAPRPKTAGKSLPRLKMQMLEKEQLRANSEALLAFSASSSSMALPRRSRPRSSRPIIHRAVDAKGKKPSGGSPVNKMSFKKGDEVRVRTPVGRLGTPALRLVMWLGAVVVSDADEDGHLEVIYNGNFPRDDPFRTVRVAVKDVKLPAPRPAPTPANMAAPRLTTAGKSLPRLKMFVLEKEQLRANSEALLAL
uniref:Uncharacterized protein n=1 Tax=Oryza rufipogon TaxID=4529 RepID=A0A0E0Q8X8_ORYRU